MSQSREAGLPVSDDMAPHRREWLFERMGWAAMLMVVAAACTGLAGSGLMVSVARAAGTYTFLWLVFRIAGKRALAEITTFDFVLLLIISETTQGALVGDAPLSNALLLVITMVGLDIGLSLLKQRSRALQQVMDGLPLLIVRDGQVLHDRLDKERIDEDDILTAARLTHGIDRLTEIRHAILERDGGISIIPRQR